MKTFAIVMISATPEYIKEVNDIDLEFITIMTEWSNGPKIKKGRTYFWNGIFLLSRF